MGFFKKFGITFGNKKNNLLPASSIQFNSNIEPTIFSQTDSSAYKTLATFDINLERPKYEGAIPEATVRFYPIK